VASVAIGVGQAAGSSTICSSEYGVARFRRFIADVIATEFWFVRFAVERLVKLEMLVSAIGFCLLFVFS
jgi:hypothetical protein